MAVPIGLGIVDSEVNSYTGVVRPLLNYLLVIKKVCLASRAVDDIDIAVAIAVMSAVIDNRAQGRKTNTARDKEKVLARKYVVYGEWIAVRTANCDLLTDLCLMEPLGNATALLNGKFHIFGVCGGRGYREHSLTDSVDREHCALSGTMIKGFLSVGGYDSEGLDIGCVYANVGNNADRRNQSIIDIIHLYFLQASS